MFDSLRDLLSGKKTYLVMAGLVIKAIIEYIADGDMGKLINAILIAIGGMTLRAGVSKSEGK